MLLVDCGHLGCFSATKTFIVQGSDPLASCMLINYGENSIKLKRLTKKTFLYDGERECGLHDVSPYIRSMFPNWLLHVCRE